MKIFKGLAALLLFWVCVNANENLQYLPEENCVSLAEGLDFEPIIYETGQANLSGGGIGFINGINTDFDRAVSHANRLSSYAGAKVYYIYNPIQLFSKDILKSYWTSRESPMVDLVKKMWQSFFDANHPDAKFLQICHSYGASVVKSALEASSKEVRRRIIVLAISPAVIIPKKICSKSYNYVSKRDVVPYFNITGNVRHGKELKKLKPHKDASFFDHGFDSPTYEEVIKKCIQSYLNSLNK